MARILQTFAAIVLYGLTFWCLLAAEASLIPLRQRRLRTAGGLGFLVLLIWQPALR